MHKKNLIKATVFVQATDVKVSEYVYFMGKSETIPSRISRLDT